MSTVQTALHFAAFHGNIEMVQALPAHNAPVNVLESEHKGNPPARALHGSQHSWYCEKGDYPAVTRALPAAGSSIPQAEKPLDASEDALEVIRQHTSLR